MISYNDKKPTIIELMKWKRNKTINPRTNRKIKKNKILYNYLKRNYNELFKEDYDYLDSIDNRDPVTLKNFWILKNGQKKFIYENYNNLLLYKDNNNNIRCIEKESLEYLKFYNIKKDPVTQKDFPKNILSMVKDIKIIKNESLESKGLRVFNKFSNISVFIDYKKFLELDVRNLKKFNYEISDFYYKNLSLENRKIIDNRNGNYVFTLSNNNLDEKSREYILNYLLDQIDIIMSCKNDNLKFMINYIVIGSLGIVIPEIKEQYPDFSFEF